MSKLHILLVSGLLVTCSVLASGQKSIQLSSMTFNIRYASADDKDNSWQFRHQRVVKMIKMVHPDILGLQEAEQRQLTDILSKLTDYRFVGVGRDDGKTRGEYSPILYQFELFKLLQHHTFWLSDTPEIAGSKSWGNDIPRICSWARFEEINTGKTFYVFNMHWDHISQPSRIKSARLVLNVISRREFADDPVVVMGDFNVGGDNPAFSALLTSAHQPLVDAFAATHPQTNLKQGTFHGFTGIATLPRIDAILVSENIKVIHSDILKQQFDEHFPSDHFPLSALLEVK